MDKSSEIKAAASQLLAQIVAMPRGARNLSERMRPIQEKGLCKPYNTRVSSPVR